MADNRHKVVKHFRFTETEAKTLRKFAQMYGMTDSDYMQFPFKPETGRLS